MLHNKDPQTQWLLAVTFVFLGHRSRVTGAAARAALLQAAGHLHLAQTVCCIQVCSKDLFLLLKPAAIQTYCFMGMTEVQEPDTLHILSLSYGQSKSQGQAQCQ
jgi:hypothetical protein